MKLLKGNRYDLTIVRHTAMDSLLESIYHIIDNDPRGIERIKGRFKNKVIGKGLCFKETIEGIELSEAWGSRDMLGRIKAKQSLPFPFISYTTNTMCR